MLTNEKEYNGYLFDQLAMLERIQSVATEETVIKQCEIEKRWIERKLYQPTPSKAENN